VSHACILGCAGPKLSANERAFFREVKPWGFILFKRNLETPDQVKKLVDSMRRAVDHDQAPVLIDQEGGRVQRLGPPNWPKYPPGRAYGAAFKDDPQLRREMTRLGARLMAHDLAREVVAELVPLADAGHIDLGIAVAQPATVAGDGDALRTLLRNLVDNAVRYTPSGGRVDVSVEAPLTGSSGGARLTVTDDGPGIAPADRARVFDRFYRRPGTAPPGSGLGLAIVKAIADGQGASVQLADGADGKGLAVSVTFPPPSV